ncbi:hypothetical protein BHM03_00018542, partial [Ensete ventricosum]
ATLESDATILTSDGTPINHARFTHVTHGRHTVVEAGERLVGTPLHRSVNHRQLRTSALTSRALKLEPWKVNSAVEHSWQGVETTGDWSEEKRRWR